MTDWKAAKEAAVNAVIAAQGPLVGSPERLADEEFVKRAQGWRRRVSEAYVQAALDALKAHGYVVVPAEATQEMCLAVQGRFMSPNPIRAARYCYDAMIKAAQADME